jgi:hypothetical protein
MTTVAAYTTIRAFIEANFTAVPMGWENEQSPDTNGAEGFDAPWVYVQMTGDIWDQMSIGAGDRLDNRWQEEGELLLDVIVPLDTGTIAARTIATTLANLFRGLQLGDIEFRDISIGIGVIAEDRGPWWLLPVRINWQKG